MATGKPTSAIRAPRRTSPNVSRMRLLGAEVVAVESGSRTLKDAISEAMRDWIENVATTHYVLGSALGPHPYPTMVREFQSVIGREARAQFRRPSILAEKFITIEPPAGSVLFGGQDLARLVRADRGAFARRERTALDAAIVGVRRVHRCSSNHRRVFVQRLGARAIDADARDDLHLPAAALHGALAMGAARAGAVRPNARRRRTYLGRRRGRGVAPIAPIATDDAREHLTSVRVIASRTSVRIADSRLKGASSPASSPRSRSTSRRARVGPRRRRRTSCSRAPASR